MTVLLVITAYVIGFVVQLFRFGPKVLDGTGPRTIHWDDLLRDFPDASEEKKEKWRQSDLNDLRTTALERSLAWPSFLVVWAINPIVLGIIWALKRMCRLPEMTVALRERVRKLFRKQ